MNLKALLEIVGGIVMLVIGSALIVVIYIAMRKPRQTSRHSRE